MKALKAILLSDFTLTNLGGYLSSFKLDLPISVLPTPFGQPASVILDGNHNCWNEHPDMAIVWCRPEAVFESFRRCMDGEELNVDGLMEEVDAFAALLHNLSSKVRFVFVASFTINANRANGLLALTPQSGIKWLLLEVNRRLALKLVGWKGFYMLDAERWLALAGSNAYQPTSWYLSKVPFHRSVFAHAAAEIHHAVKALLGQSKKIVLVDLDDTLWGGVVGDEGWENLKLGGHSAIGEAFVDVQKLIKSWKNKGILVGIVSKNTESIALEAIEKNQEMVLKKSDFCGWRINWEDKALNIVDLVAELNLGIESVVFIDDNATERERVKSALPQVTVVDLPEDKLLVPQFLSSLDLFTNPFISEEDKIRSQLYSEERERLLSKQGVQSLEEWLAGNKIEIAVETVGVHNLQRVIQLLNKTNQMNLCTRRLTEGELTSWLGNAENKMWGFRVRDRFGDAGLTGILGLTIKDNRAIISDFVLSCRVMGRKTEEVLMHVASKMATTFNCTELQATCIRTEKNGPCFAFFNNAGLKAAATNEFSYNCSVPYPYPAYITLTYDF